MSGQYHSRPGRCLALHRSALLLRAVCRYERPVSRRKRRDRQHSKYGSPSLRRQLPSAEEHIQTAHSTIWEARITRPAAPPPPSCGRSAPKHSICSTRPPKTPIPKSQPAPTTCCGKLPSAGCSPTTRRSFAPCCGNMARKPRAPAAAVEQLARLPKGADTAALVASPDSIARRWFREPRRWRSFARKERTRRRLPIDAAVDRTKLGASTRVSAVWLRQYLAQLRDPAAVVAAWKQLIDQESARLEKTGETSNDIVLACSGTWPTCTAKSGDQAATHRHARSHDRTWPAKSRTKRSLTSCVADREQIVGCLERFLASIRIASNKANGRSILRPSPA